MTSYFYDMIAIDTDIDATLATMVCDVEQINEKMSRMGDKVDHDLWQRMRFFGASRGWPEGLNPHEHWHGTSLELAPFVGVGFYRDRCLHFEIPAILREPWEPQREAIRRFSISKAEKEIPIRGPEVELVK